MSELEIVHYKQIEGVSLFLNTVVYRTAHFHQDWELLLGLDNNLIIKAESETFSAKKGEIVLFPPSTVHEFQAENTPCTFLCLQVSSDFINLGSNLFTTSFHPADYLSEDELGKVKKVLFDVLECLIKEPELYRLYCAGKCNLLMFNILRKMPMISKTREEMNIQNKKNERLNRLIDFVNENYMHKIKLSDFADREGLTMNYLSHFIKDSLNQNFQSYVNTVRFHAACKMIALKSEKMTDVFRKTGFSDYKYFSKTFREHCGMTPEEYSKQFDSASQVLTQVQTSINSSERRLTKQESLALIEKEKKIL